MTCTNRCDAFDAFRCLRSLVLAEKVSGSPLTVSFALMQTDEAMTTNLVDENQHAKLQQLSSGDDFELLGEGAFCTDVWPLAITPLEAMTLGVNSVELDQTRSSFLHETLHPCRKRGQFPNVVADLLQELPSHRETTAPVAQDIADLYRMVLQSSTSGPVSTSARYSKLCFSDHFVLKHVIAERSFAENWRCKRLYLHRRVD